MAVVTATGTGYTERDQTTRAIWPATSLFRLLGLRHFMRSLNTSTHDFASVVVLSIFNIYV